MALQRIISLFRKRETTAPSQWIKPQAASELLQTPYRQELIQTLYQMGSFPSATFEQFVRQPIERYAEWVQLLPASETHHHAYSGGMLDHALEIMCYALRIRRKHLLPPGARPEDQVSIGELWSCAVLYTALLHDLPKALVDVEILLQDGTRWHLWNGLIPKPYKIRYRTGRDYHLHEAMGTMFCRNIMGGSAMDWLFTDPELFAMVMYALSGHSEKAGIIGEIVHQADKTSAAKAMGGDIGRLASIAPQHSLQRKLVDGLRHLIRSGKLSVNGTKGSAIYLTDEAVWLVSPRVPRELKAYLLEQGIAGIPSDESRLYDEMLAHSLISPTPSGQAVWSGCTISIGDWSTSSLHLLKAAPSLIWGTDDERPEPKAHVQPPVTKTVVDSTTLQTATIEQAVSEAKSPHPVALESAIQENHEELNDRSDVSSISIKSPRKDEQNEDTAQQTAIPTAKAQEVLPAPSCIQTLDTPALSMGEDFVQWVRTGLADHTLAYNAKGAIHTTENCLPLQELLPLLQELVTKPVIYAMSPRPCARCSRKQLTLMYRSCLPIYAIWRPFV